MNTRSCFTLVPLLTALLTLSSCAVLFKPKPHADSPGAAGLFRKLQETNSTLSTFGGAGKVKLRKGSDTFHYPISWVGEAPDRMRLVLLDPVRRPLETLVSDGKRLFALSHAGKHPFYSASLTSTSLKNLISIPAGVGDLLSLLRGRPPLRTHDHVSLTPSPEGNGSVLTLTKRNGRIVEKIFVDRDKEVYKVAVYNIRGSLSWHAEFLEMQDKRGFRVPRRLSLRAGGAEVAVTLDRYRDNLEVPSRAFVLGPLP